MGSHQRALKEASVLRALIEGGSSPDPRVYMGMTTHALREYLRRTRWPYSERTLWNRAADFPSYKTRDHKTVLMSRFAPPSVQEVIRVTKIGGRKGDADRFCFIEDPRGFVLMVRLHPPLPPLEPRPAGEPQVQSMRVPLRLSMRLRPEDYIRSYDEVHHQWVWTRKDAPR